MAAAGRPGTQRPSGVACRSCARSWRRASPLAGAAAASAAQRAVSCAPQTRLSRLERAVALAHTVQVPQAQSCMALWGPPQACWQWLAFGGVHATCSQCQQDCAASRGARTQAAGGLGCTCGVVVGAPPLGVVAGAVGGWLVVMEVGRAGRPAPGRSALQDRTGLQGPSSRPGWSGTLHTGSCMCRQTDQPGMHAPRAFTGVRCWTTWRVRSGWPGVSGGCSCI